jgi:hypothetical protein
MAERGAEGVLDVPDYGSLIKPKTEALAKSDPSM